MNALRAERRTRLEDILAGGSVVSAASVAPAPPAPVPAGLPALALAPALPPATTTTTAPAAPAPPVPAPVGRAPGGARPDARPASPRPLAPGTMPPAPLPVLPGLSGVLPGGGLRPGAVYCVERSALLATALLAEVSRTGRWCAVIGIPGFGAEAAAGLGADLTRIAVVPAPGRSWATVLGTLAEAVAVTLLAPPQSVSPGEAGRIEARLRQQSSALVVLGSWPRPEARLGVAAVDWDGIGNGHGHLSGHRLVVTVAARQDGGRERTAEIALPELAPSVPPDAPASVPPAPPLPVGPPAPRSLDREAVAS